MYNQYMSTAILSTKLYIPKTRRQHVIRPRLLDRLNGGLQDKLLLVSAPAGCGKTTLVSEWLTTIDYRVAWLSLDEKDSDPIRYWMHFIAAIQKILPDIGQDLLNVLQSPQPPAIDTLLVSLLNDIEAIQDDFIVVLDDYHLVDNPAIDEALDFLLKHLPSTMHLVIVTREDPQLPLASLRARHQMTELRESDLRFTLDEAAAFLNQTMGLNLSFADVAILEKRTEGWVTGLQLAALALGRQESTDTQPVTTNLIDEFSGSHRFVLDYLIAEVLQHQSEPIRRFLLQTSILNRLNARLCDAVCKQQNSADILAVLERGNMFIIQLDDQRQWYRYHHLFADVLQANLTKEEPEYIPDLHSRAREWYEQQGLIEDAIQHALMATDFDRAADLIELEWSTIQQSFEYVTFSKWMETLPDEFIRKRPVLCAAYGWTLIFQGDLNTADMWLGVAEEWLGVNKEVGQESKQVTDRVVVNEVEWRFLSATMAIARMIHAQASGNTVNVVKYGQHALDLLPEDDHFRRAVASGILGLAYWAAGELDSAYQLLTASTEHNLKIDRIYNAVSNSPVIAYINFARGWLNEAIDTYEHALELVRSQSKTPMKGAADLYLGLAEMHLEQGDLATAIDYLQKSETLGAQAAFAVNLYRKKQVQARFKMIQGDQEDALNLLEAAEQAYTPSVIPDLRPIAATKARIWISKGSLNRAGNWLRKRGISPDDDLSYLHEYEYITLARLLIAQYQDGGTVDFIEQASRLLERLFTAAEEGNRIASMIEILILQTLAARAMGRINDALACLERAMQLAEPATYMQVFIDEGKLITQLLGEMLKRGMMPTFTRLLLTMIDARIQPNSDGEQVAESPPVQPLLEPLSQRELDVLRLFKTELSGPEIARELVVALSTVRTHTKGIYRKLDVNNRRAAVKRAEELNLI